MKTALVDAKTLLNVWRSSFEKYRQLIETTELSQLAFYETDSEEHRILLLTINLGEIINPRYRSKSRNAIDQSIRAGRLPSEVSGLNEELNCLVALNLLREGRIDRALELFKKSILQLIGLGRFESAIAYLLLFVQYLVQARRYRVALMQLMDCGSNVASQQEQTILLAQVDTVHAYLLAEAGRADASERILKRLEAEFSLLPIQLQRLNYSIRVRNLISRDSHAGAMDVLRLAAEHDYEWLFSNELMMAHLDAVEGALGLGRAAELAEDFLEQWPYSSPYLRQHALAFLLKQATREDELRPLYRHAAQEVGQRTSILNNFCDNDLILRLP
ncbi:MAG: hypothetical protein HWE20_11480 [Gammaproteobacteria bacterium]|nr:hypothetical protein [Gammaproteobacteria bacterium]